MKPKGKNYKNVIITHRWEKIEDSHHLVTIAVSNYIRKLEEDNQELKELFLEYFDNQGFTGYEGIEGKRIYELMAKLGSQRSIDVTGGPIPR